MTLPEAKREAERLLGLAMRDFGKTREEVLAIWREDQPHFGGAVRHFFARGGPCVYCCRPNVDEILWRSP